MKPIEGLDLGDLVEDVRKDLLRERRAEITKMINGIYINLSTWQAAKKRAEAEVKKADEKIAKAQDKLNKIKAGDWSVLEEEKPQNQGQKPKEDNEG